jgi:glyoxylase-like metal-dependent hydrolase (beta-lactamase superfamily II)
VPEGGLDYYAAAIRECFEEAGLLFATDASGDLVKRLATGPAGLRPVNMEEPAYEEVGLVDPDGAGHGRYVHEAGLVMRLSARTVRVTDGTELAHSYFVGAAGGDCALIDPLSADAAHVEALRAAAPGRVRWILWTRAQAGAPANARDALMAAWPEASVEQPAPGDELIIGDARLQVLSSAGDTQARQFLLVEEHTLFTGAAQPPMIADADLVQWIAPGQGFMRRALHGV